MSRTPSLGMMFFASHQDALTGDKYRLLVESAKFADQHDFSSVWVPERHFTRFGCLFPNPAVLHAALARETSRVQLRAGSVVLPLHDPVRVVEEWAMVDNLSGGRVGVSFASGWNPNDFVLKPGNYSDRHDLLFSSLEKVKTLWQGGSVSTLNGNGEQVEVSVFPTPVQRELPVWITAAGNPVTYERAGAAGANLLTHVLDHGVEKLATLIDIYRRSRAEHGYDPETGIVTVMLHTFVGEEEAGVREKVREPFCSYLKSNFGLLQGLAASRGQSVNIAALSSADLDTFVSFLFERFYSSRALIGTPESCAPLVKELGVIGVDEIACLLDFGPAPDVILEHLPYLNRLRAMTATARSTAAEQSLPSLAVLQQRCTDHLSGADFYRQLEERDVELTGAFSSIAAVWRGNGEALAQVRKPSGIETDAFATHPAFLDCMFQSLVMAAPAAQFDAGGLYLPSGLRSFETKGEPGEEVWSHAVLRSNNGASLEGDVTVRSAAGEVLVRAEGLRLERLHSAAPAGSDLTYEVEWIAAEAPSGAAPTDGPWLIIGDPDGIGSHLRARLSEQGHDCELIAHPSQSATFSRIRGVVYLAGWQDILSLVHTLPRGAQVWVATRGGQAVGHATVSPDEAMLWGIGRTWAAELPEQWRGLVDLDPTASSEECASQLYSFLAADDGEDQVAFRNGSRYVARLVRSQAITRRRLRLSPDAAYLVTGGRQGFGLEVARRLAERGAKHLILFGRKQAPGSFEDLESLGASVTYAAVDVSDRAAVARFLESWGGPQIRGVIHAASAWRDDSGATLVRTLDQLDRSAFDAVLGPKRDGALILADLLATQPLDFFVLFSSGASLLGSAGQGNYAAASSWLDALAALRQSAGLPALSINWGPISAAGFGGTEEGLRLHQLWESLGISRIAPAEALDLMESLIRDGRAQCAAMRMDWDRIARSFPGLAASPYLERLVSRTSSQAPVPEFVQRFYAAPEADRFDLLLDHVRDTVAAVMELEAGEHPDLDRGLFESGMDSLMVLELKNRLQASLGRDIPATLAFEYPTVRALARYLFHQFAPDTKPVERQAAEPVASADSILQRIQGMSEGQARATLSVRAASR